MPTTAEKTEKNSKSPTSDYAAFLRSLQLYVISLKESACAVDQKAYWENKNRKLTYKMDAESIGIQESTFDVRTKVEVMMTGGKQKHNVLRISATFDLHFHASSIPKTLVDRFCNSDVRLIVWPYFREYVSDVSSRMYIPPVILPLSNEQGE